MSWILIVVIAIFAIFGLIGWYKGIIKIAVSLLTLVITIIAAVFVAPIIGQTLKNNTSLYDKLQESVANAVVNSKMFDESTDAIVDDNEVNTDYMNEEDIMSGITKVVDVMNLPDSVIGQIDEALDTSYIGKLMDSGNTTIKGLVAAVVAVRLTAIVYNAIMYIIVFIVVFAILRIIVFATGLVSRLPVIHQANKIAGLAVGLAEGLVIVWLMFIVITAFSNQTWAANALADIGQNSLLEFMYNNNFILKSTFKNI